MMPSNFTGGTWRGVVTGLLSGAIFFVVVGLSEMGTHGFFFLARAAAIPFFGAEATGPGPIFVGLVSHFVIAALWGMLFGWVAWSQPKGLTMMLGLCWGFLVWALMIWAVAPLAGAGEFVRTPPLGRFFVCHAIFGFVLGLAFAALQRREESPGRILPAHATGRL